MPQIKQNHVFIGLKKAGCSGPDPGRNFGEIGFFHYKISGNEFVRIFTLQKTRSMASLRGGDIRRFRPEG